MVGPFFLLKLSGFLVMLRIDSIAYFLQSDEF